MSIDIGFLLTVAAFWLGGLSALVGVIWFAGEYLAERNRRHAERRRRHAERRRRHAERRRRHAASRRPAAPIVPLDLDAARARRRGRGAA